MSKSPTGELSVEFDGKTWTLLYDWAAIAWFERTAGVSFLTIGRAVEKGEPPMLSHLAWLMQAGLQRHHPEVDLDTAGKMAVTPSVFEALGIAVDAATPDAGSSAEGNAVAKPLRKSTGTTPSKPRSKRG